MTLASILRGHGATLPHFGSNARSLDLVRAEWLHRLESIVAYQSLKFCSHVSSRALPRLL
jgi:hypothetical protein